MDWLPSQSKKLKTVQIAKSGERKKGVGRNSAVGSVQKGGQQGVSSTSKNRPSLHKYKSPKQIELKNSLHKERMKPLPHVIKR